MGGEGEWEEGRVNGRGGGEGECEGNLVYIPTPT